MSHNWTINMLNLHLKKVKTNTHPVINDPTFSPLRKIKAMTKLENFQVQSYLLITTDSRTATPHMLLRVLNNVNWNIGNNHKSLTCSSSTWITLDPATRLQYSNLVSQFTSKPLPNAFTALIAVCNAGTCSSIKKSFTISYVPRWTFYLRQYEFKGKQNNPCK